MLGLVPPSVWRLLRGGRLAPNVRGQERRHIDMDDFVWEVFMASVSVCAIVFALGAINVLPVFGGGFALAKDQKETARQVYEGRLDQIEGRRFDLKIRQCDAIKKGDSAQVYTELLRDQAKIYKTLAGKDPPPLP